MRAAAWCEAENYLAPITRGTVADLNQARVHLQLTNGVPTLTQVNAVLLFRALAGVALKTHLAPHHMLRQQHLAKSEVALLRRSLLRDDYPPERFGLYAQKWLNRTVPDVNPRSSLHIGFRRRDGLALAHLSMAGVTWSLAIGNGDRFRETFEADMGRQFSFRVGEPWAIVPVEWVADEVMTHDNAVALEDLEEGEPFNQTDDCPCGLGLQFGKCCAGRWLPAQTVRWQLTADARERGWGVPRGGIEE